MNLQDLEILYESLKSKQSSSQTRYISYHSLYKTAFMFKSIFKQYNMIDDVSLDEFLLCYPVLALIESLIHGKDSGVSNAVTERLLKSQNSLN